MPSEKTAAFESVATGLKNFFFVQSGGEVSSVVFFRDFDNDSFAIVLDN